MGATHVPLGCTWPPWRPDLLPVRRLAAAVPSLALRLGAGRIAAAVAPAVWLYTAADRRGGGHRAFGPDGGAGAGGGPAGRLLALATSIATAALVLVRIASGAADPLVPAVVRLGDRAGRVRTPPGARRAAPGAPAWRRCGLAGTSAAATLAASVATAPLVAHHFGRSPRPRRWATWRWCRWSSWCSCRWGWAERCWARPTRGWATSLWGWRAGRAGWRCGWPSSSAGWPRVLGAPSRRAGDRGAGAGRRAVLRRSLPGPRAVVAWPRRDWPRRPPA